MTRFTVGLLLATVVFSFPGTAAVADIDVDPVGRKPSLRLEGVRVHGPAPAVGRPLNKRDGDTPVNDPSYDPSYDRIYMQCRVDPDNAIYGCRTATPNDPAAPADPDAPERRELTPGDILRAAREIGLPSLQVQIQPGDETLVNVETIFYAEPQTFQRSIELLGYDVDLVAQPASYHWVHGDGTTRSTSMPGKPYPAMDVTHRYRRPAEDVRARVDVTYRVRYRVDGGPWQTIGQTLVASGPAAQLDVREAAPVLTRP